MTNTTKFETASYPFCCGISILFDFYTNYEASLEYIKTYIINEFLKNVSVINCAPIIQFVAVQEGLYVEEDYNTDGGEFISFSKTYQMHKFVTTLITLMHAKPISIFYNKNSGNKCTVFQFKNPMQYLSLKEKQNDFYLEIQTEADLLYRIKEIN